MFVYNKDCSNATTEKNEHPVSVNPKKVGTLVSIT